MNLRNKRKIQPTENHLLLQVKKTTNQKNKKKTNEENLPESSVHQDVIDVLLERFFINDPPSNEESDNEGCSRRRKRKTIQGNEAAPVVTGPNSRHRDGVVVYNDQELETHPTGNSDLALPRSGVSNRKAPHQLRINSTSKSNLKQKNTGNGRISGNTRKEAGGKQGQNREEGSSTRSKVTRNKICEKRRLPINDEEEDESESETEDHDVPINNYEDEAELDDWELEDRKKIHVEFNERGQSVGKNSSEYSSSLGLISRKVPSITVSTWHKVPKTLKEKMWTIVKKRFVVPERAKKMTIKSIGKMWRGYKVCLRRRYCDIHDNDDDRIAGCPTNIKLADWKIFVANTSTPEYVEKRKKAKESSKHHKIPHTCSRKGYARLEDELKRNSDDPASVTRADVWVAGHKKKTGEPVNEFAQEIIDKINEAPTSAPYSRDDTLSQVLGQDPDGHVRGVGFGIAPSTLLLHELKEEIKTLREKVVSMEATQKEISTLKEMLVQVMEFQNQSAGQPSEASAPEDQIPTVQSKSLQSSPGVRKSVKFVKCKLIRLVPEDVVAHGYWCTDDPKTLVHCVALGNGMSKVLVETAVQGDALLVRKTDDLKTMEDAVGSFVAWPTSAIIKD